MLRTLNIFLLLLLTSALLQAQEVCNNALDDDGDGLIDLNDPDCPCATVLMAEDLPSYIRNHSFEEQLCCPFGLVSEISPPWLDCATGWHQATTGTSDYLHMCGFAPSGMPLPPPDGQGAVGFGMSHDYKEYVGTCLTYPPPANILLAGTTYTLSLWIAATATNNNHTATLIQSQSISALFPDQVPLAIFGYANACVPFPVSVPPGNGDCIGAVPGWNELGRVMVQPSWNWVRVSITFTPAQDIHTIMIGSACDIPASFTHMPFLNNDGSTTMLSSYFIVDDLMLTVAGDQMLSPTEVRGDLCASDAFATAHPPVGATDHQWYRDGVTLAGQTGTTLNISAGGFGPGLYTMSSSYNGQCLMGTTYLPPPASPRPWPLVEPATGCAPLTVSFADTTGGGTTTVQWDLGNGLVRTDSAFNHTYTTPGTYDVGLRISNGAGCMGDTLMHGAVVVYPAMSATIVTQPDPADVDAPQVTLTGTGTANIISWWWDLGVADPATANAQVVTATFPAVPGSYPVMLVVQNAAGCVDTVRSVVRVTSHGAIEMPNVFSPNGDGHNDRFIPLDYTGAPCLLEIYNRWGQKVFSTTALAQGWDGHTEGGEVPGGTYYYVVIPDDASLEERAGHVTLLR
jgi:gliding motility-associated-like protein